MLYCGGTASLCALEVLAHSAMLPTDMIVVQALFAGRVLPFDEKAGLVWARLMADGAAKGRPRSPLDMIIAAVAEANNCVVVTENERDFAGLKIVNPLRAN